LCSSETMGKIWYTLVWVESLTPLSPHSWRPR
jgi:hypothetical protein